MDGYRFSQIEPKWQRLWQESSLYAPDIWRSEKPYYNLWMFPYPSGARMHVGHAYASTGADIHGRFMRMRGYDVFQPMGFDAFGIHGENYALKVGRKPGELMDELCDRYRDEQFRKMGHGYDWSHEVRTYEPQYYKWTQWIFLKLYEAGLAVRREAAVNWCPSCKTVLADEQVIQGLCERCDTQVVDRRLKQWFFKITNYAEGLLANLHEIDWPEKIKTMQRNWIGKSKGARIKFPVAGREGDLQIEVFTTRPDTLFGATFFVLAPESKWVQELASPSRAEEVSEYVKNARSLAVQERLQREEKTGVFTGSYVTNPANGSKIPVYVADYVLHEYGGGAVMGVPAHDHRDYQFAKKYKLPVVKVVQSPSEPDGGEGFVYEGRGKMTNSGQFSGMDSEEGKRAIVSWLSKSGLAEMGVEYKLRDWCISRQRYWGAPIPIIFCDKCGEVPVPEESLPVVLPETENWHPTGTAESPLAGIKDFVETTCPVCEGEARRETDVCDNFLDSAWYYYSYPVYNSQIERGRASETEPLGAPSQAKGYPFQPEILRKWLPVDMYVGGAEHSVLHLMYTRFITMAFKDIGLVNFEEPFKTFFAHGLITKEGAKMSKSKGNIVNPDEYLERVGADVFRTYLMFLGPYDSGGDFSDSGIKGVVRFLDRVWGLVSEPGGALGEEMDEERLFWLSKTVKKVTEDIAGFSFNTAVAALMEWVGEIVSWDEGMRAEEKRVFLKLLAPFAPHFAEELWQETASVDPKRFSAENSVHRQSWPSYNPGDLKRDRITLVVEVNGRLRGKCSVPPGESKEQVVRKASELEKVRKYLDQGEVVKTIFVPDKLINFVVE